MSPVTYSTMIEGKTKDSKFQLRLELVRYAQDKGIREATRAFRCSRNTVRKWLRRYEDEHMSGLNERSCAPHNIPHKTSAYIEDKVIVARKEVPCYGAKRLKEMFCLKPSEGAIARIIRQNGLTKRPKKKYQKKRDLREVKAKYMALSHHQEDTKFLYDMPHYWISMKKHRLPKFQYTIRDTKSGTLMLAFAEERSMKCAEMAAQRYLDHLKAYGIEPAETTFQTDGGSEFSGTLKKKAQRGFTHTIEEVYKAKHCYIPPGCPNANADVESSHAIIENEFYDIEGFTGRDDFLRKVAIFQHYFNFVRPNSYKKGKTPWQIVKEERPGISPEVLLLPPVILDDIFRPPFRFQIKDDRVGHNVPVDPGSSEFYLAFSFCYIYINCIISVTY